MKHLIDHFILKLFNSNIYYPQGNGWANSANKALGTLLTILVSEINMDWDKHLPTFVFLHNNIQSSYKIHITPAGLHPLMPTKYIFPIINSDHKEGNPMRILTSRILELKKL